MKLAESVDGSACDGGDVTEADTFLEEADFFGILLLVGIFGLAVGGGTAHFDPSFAALGYVLVTTAGHPFLDGQSFHRSDFKQDGADERGHRIHLTVGAEGLKVVVLDIQADPVLVEALNDFEGFEGITTETANFEADHFVDGVRFHISNHVHDFGPFFNALGTTDLIAENRLHTPAYFATVVRQFVNLPLVFLFVRAHTSQNDYTLHCIVSNCIQKQR